ncbi:hypothetical protein [uncultured Massilia sp.]|uniref:hypothetical protein n=1 Tax=uncultured Massilia sp. TaxID=169973 RepID=UPI0026009F69|nr:hypothetical protein [uncultured Massilia sp.]
MSSHLAGPQRPSFFPAPRWQVSILALALACGLGACKRAEPPAPAPAAQPAPAPAVPERTRDQAMAQVLALPEVKAWSEQIEQKSKGKVHGAVIEDDPTPRVIDGKSYYQLSFVENRRQDVHRRASFLVARQGDDILVESLEDDSVQSLGEWRRNIQRVELKGN